MLLAVVGCGGQLLVVVCSWLWPATAGCCWLREAVIGHEFGPLTQQQLLRGRARMFHHHGQTDKMSVDRGTAPKVL